VLFTEPKKLVKAVGATTVYLIENGEKRRVISPIVFDNHRLSWDAAQQIDLDQLKQIPNGTPLTQ
jgi:hypothetical protein